METLLLQYLSDWPLLAYLLIFFGMVVEGANILFIVVFAVFMGYIDPLYGFAAAFLGAFLGDIGWYWFGKPLSKFLPKKARALLFTSIDEHLKAHPATTIIVSKFIYLINRLTLVRVRPVRVPFKKFLIIDTAGIMLLIITVSGLGSIFYASFSLVRQYFHFAEIGLAIGIIIFIIIERRVSKTLRARWIQ